MALAAKRIRAKKRASSLRSFITSSIASGRTENKGLAGVGVGDRGRGWRVPAELAGVGSGGGLESGVGSEWGQLELREVVGAVSWLEAELMDDADQAGARAGADDSAAELRDVNPRGPRCPLDMLDAVCAWQDRVFTRLHLSPLLSQVEALVTPRGTRTVKVSLIHFNIAREEAKSKGLAGAHAGEVGFVGTGFEVEDESADGEGDGEPDEEVFHAQRQNLAWQPQKQRHSDLRMVGS